MPLATFLCRVILAMGALGLAGLAVPVQGADPTYGDLLKESRRVVFLGDSITAAGGYVAAVEAWMLTQRYAPHPLVINMGLSSETVSGLSEEGHAGGKFPRPVLSERLDRVLKTGKPDLVFACYGMNCGIYLPYNEVRFAQYRGGLNMLREATQGASAKIVHITPACFDDARGKKEFSYNKVLQQYSEWLVAQRSQNWNVISLHQPMTAELERRRMTDAAFTFQPDAVHPNADGHWFVAQQIICSLGDRSVLGDASAQEMLKRKGFPETLMPLIVKRSKILQDSYVATAGHLRPGVAKGKPIGEAEQEAAMIWQQIEGLIPPR